jgi:hypothetical protein
MDIRERLQRNYRDYTDQLGHIRSDDMRSGKAKGLEIGELYEKHSGVHDELEAEYRSDLDSRLAESRQKAFKPPRVGDDAALDMISFRDTHLAKAGLLRGYELGSNALVGEYLGGAPASETKSWQDFSEVAAENNAFVQLGFSGTVGGTPTDRPSELGGSSAALSFSGGALRGVSDFERALSSNPGETVVTHGVVVTSTQESPE